MIAYKFLRSGRIGPFSGFSWPEPGAWVQSDSGAELCRAGVHACRAADLPWWLADELWEVELGGEVQIDDHKLAAQRGTLRSRIAEWTADCAQDYGEACAWRARDTASRALRRAGHHQASKHLDACGALDDLVSITRPLAAGIAETRISLTMAGDGAFRAITGASPTSAYIAAHAALRLDGPAAYAAERTWQANWLIDRLGLRP
jgi:hypothetical protein